MIKDNQTPFCATYSQIIEKLRAYAAIADEKSYLIGKHLWNSSKKHSKQNNGLHISSINAASSTKKTQLHTAATVSSAVELSLDK